MGIFEGYLLASDFDGTLIGADHRISAANLDAVKTFMAEGGVFCGATGRSEANIVPFLGGLPLDWPWILYNGGALYDFTAHAFVQRAALPQTSTAAYLRRVMAEVPEVDIHVFAGGPFHRVNPAAPLDPIILKEGQAFHDTPLDDVPDGWIKVLLSCQSAPVLDRVKSLLESDPLRSQVYTTLSAPCFFELTSLSINKGTALADLRAHLEQRLSRPFHTVAAIGDYLNDLAMLNYADIAGAPATALPEVRAAADHVTAGHDDHAVADFINCLRLHARRV